MFYNSDLDAATEIPFPTMSTTSSFSTQVRDYMPMLQVLLVLCPCINKNALALHIDRSSVRQHHGPWAPQTGW